MLRVSRAAVNRTLPLWLAALAHRPGGNHPKHSNGVAVVIKLAAHVIVVYLECVELIGVTVSQVH